MLQSEKCCHPTQRRNDTYDSWFYDSWFSSGYGDFDVFQRDDINLISSSSTVDEAHLRSAAPKV